MFDNVLDAVPKGCYAIELNPTRSATAREPGNFACPVCERRGKQKPGLCLADVAPRFYQITTNMMCSIQGIEINKSLKVNLPIYKYNHPIYKTERETFHENRNRLRGRHAR